MYTYCERGVEWISGENDVFPQSPLLSLLFPLSDPGVPLPRSSSLATVLLSVPSLECPCEEVEAAYVTSSSSNSTSSSIPLSLVELMLPKIFLRGVWPGALIKSAKLEMDPLPLAPRR